MPAQPGRNRDEQSGIRVRATQPGEYPGGVGRQPGDEFSIAEEQDFSRRWMERLDSAPGS